ncbi:MAG: glutamyl-tRNA(Gln) amidotransferase subunit D [Caldivirga sp. MG_3]|nr:MAG: glutamyl-tRNA(Gln) amidotransferase subunit D [Caldivirga sp. MG_3]
MILPRPEVGDPDVLLVKLENGYNAGIHVDRILKVEALGKYEPPRVEVPPYGVVVSSSGSGGVVRFIATGGTIMSRVDYVTGAVYPSFSLEDLYLMYPELRNLASIEMVNLMAIFSEDMNPARWGMIAEEACKAFSSGVRGVVVLHGTDTLHYTAAALAFALRSSPGPIALVGAQRSSDRPSSDSFENLYAATIVASQAAFAESVVVMHEGTSDGVIAVHRGVRVRKMHTSRRDAFISVNSEPIARVLVRQGKVVMNTGEYKGRGELTCSPRFDDKVALAKYYPGMSPELLEYLIDKGYHGIVIEGTGFGHVGEQLLKPIARAIEAGIPVVISSQTIFGRVNLNVYRRGVELLKLGVIPSEDMHPETAFVKLSWVLANHGRDIEEVRRVMLTPLAYELNLRTRPMDYINKPTVPNEA